jgi:hypothetical protein
MQVTELPVRRWTQDYKEFLEGLIKPDTNEVLLLTSICRQRAACSPQGLVVPAAKCHSLPIRHDGAIVAVSCGVHGLTRLVQCTERSFQTQAPLLVDFRDNSNEAEIKMTLQFASTAKAQVAA